MGSGVKALRMRDEQEESKVKDGIKQEAGRTEEKRCPPFAKNKPAKGRLIVVSGAIVRCTRDFHRRCFHLSALS